ncbi:unnamed protein product [Triticum aestivum]|uniref:Uncharacterized protein n=2 Tax=Triticum aestivum TaxID=4565 RepID=A0A9R1HUB4_WHEAT|nr:uncharacterized protein LOC123049441 [Triticum aestivum]KAF7071237.1 hypothetical protein CFC21_076616 [Triticum aestivum]SPT18567.1 unnamed protein product [Triticum aestivum]
MAILVYCVTSKALAPHTPEVFRQQRSTGISASARPRRIPIGLTTKSWGINSPIRRATQIPAVGGDPGELLRAYLPIPDFSSWVTWLVGAFFLAAPAYWRFRALEDKAEQTAEATIEMVEKVAEAAERIADDVSEAFPGNERLKKAASSVKAVADEIEKDVDKAEDILHKIDEIEEEVDSVVESFTKKGSGKNK